MHNQFKALSLSFKIAPLQIRERVSLNEAGCRKFISTLKDFIPANDILVLSTCNRTEIYYSSEKDLSKEILKLLAFEKGISNVEEIENYFTSITDNLEAVQHLFDVAIGLEAQVVGDFQIINQVKNAYQIAADSDVAGPFLHRLLHTIFFTNKRVVQETSFRDGAASVSYATVELVEELTAEVRDPKVLVLGLGEIGADVVRNFQNTGIKNVSVSNRTLEKTLALADECTINVVPFENVWQEVKEADVVISSINAAEPFISKESLQKLNILNYKFLVDLSVPRSIEKTVEEIPGILLYNIDQIHGKASAALEKRMASIPKVKAIIEQAIAEFNDWSKEMLVSPTINKLKNALEQIRQEEITRYLKSMNEEEAKKVEMITKNIMQKIIKLPVLQLKAACKRGEAETLIDVLNDLFDLESQSNKVQ
jgi:glutamyl-tRNA reductase